MDIRQAQEQFHDEEIRNQEDIINNQKQAAIIGTQRFKVINSTMFALVEMMQEQDMKSDEILRLINTEKESNLKRFQWITGAFKDQAKSNEKIDKNFS